MTEPSYAIHPAIGVARMGNAPLDPDAPDSWYLGPEAPHQIANEGRPYKLRGRIKKQAQRFRIYEYRDGVPVRELIAGAGGVTAIEWRVHLANRKAALDISNRAVGTVAAPAFPPVDYIPAHTRNPHVPLAERGRLCIDPGEQRVAEPGVRHMVAGEIDFPLPGGGSRRRRVTLGTLEVEAGTGRLLVFGGDGLSAGLLDGGFSESAPIARGTDEDYANNDGWYDDIADGSVRAVVTFADGRRISVDQPGQSAWVITAVPRYVPGINYFTTLFDVAMDAWYTARERPRPSFTRDIHPILLSVSRLQWVSAKGSEGHGVRKGGYYLDAARMRYLADNDPRTDSDPYRARMGVFRRLRNPSLDADQPRAMPSLPDEVIEEPGRDWDISAMTELQYAMLERWAAGDFEADFEGPPAPVPLDEMAVAHQPAALDLAALEGTAGTPFYPGIESWKIMRNPELYAAPLRMQRGVRPGDLTIGNALPWQADYLDCNDTWWPVQRPTHVTRDGRPLQRWAPPGWGGRSEHADYNAMVHHWWRLGFVVSHDGGASFVEVEREIEDGPG